MLTISAKNHDKEDSLRISWLEELWESVDTGMLKDTLDLLQEAESGELYPLVQPGQYKVLPLGRLPQMIREAELADWEEEFTSPELMKLMTLFPGMPAWEDKPLLVGTAMNIVHGENEVLVDYFAQYTQNTDICEALASAVSPETFEQTLQQYLEHENVEEYLLNTVAGLHLVEIQFSRDTLTLHHGNPIILPQAFEIYGKKLADRAKVYALNVGTTLTRSAKVPSAQELDESGVDTLLIYKLECLKKFQLAEWSQAFKKTGRLLAVLEASDPDIKVLGMLKAYAALNLGELDQARELAEEFADPGNYFVYYLGQFIRNCLGFLAGDPFLEPQDYVVTSEFADENTNPDFTANPLFAVSTMPDWVAGFEHLARSFSQTDINELVKLGEAADRLVKDGPLCSTFASWLRAQQATVLLRRGRVEYGERINRYSLQLQQRWLPDCEPLAELLTAQQTIFELQVNGG